MFLVLHLLFRHRLAGHGFCRYGSSDPKKQLRSRFCYLRYLVLSAVIHVSSLQSSFKVTYLLPLTLQLPLNRHLPPAVGSAFSRTDLAQLEGSILARAQISAFTWVSPVLICHRNPGQGTYWMVVHCEGLPLTSLSQHSEGG